MDWQNFQIIIGKKCLENISSSLCGLGKLSWRESKAFQNTDPSYAVHLNDVSCIAQVTHSGGSLGNGDILTVTLTYVGVYCVL